MSRKLNFLDYDQFLAMQLFARMVVENALDANKLYEDKRDMWPHFLGLEEGLIFIWSHFSPVLISPLGHWNFLNNSHAFKWVEPFNNIIRDSRLGLRRLDKTERKIFNIPAAEYSYAVTRVYDIDLALPVPQGRILRTEKTLEKEWISLMLFYMSANFEPDIIGKVTQVKSTHYLRKYSAIAGKNVRITKVSGSTITVTLVDEDDQSFDVPATDLIIFENGLVK